MIRDWWISIQLVCFVFQGSLPCDRPVSGNNRPVYILFFADISDLSFSCHLLEERNVCLLPSTKNPLTVAISFAILEQSRVILSQAGRARYIVICVNPAFTKMIDGTEKTKLSSKFA